MLRSMLVFTMLTAVVGIRLRLEEDEDNEVEEYDMFEVTKGVHDEFGFTQKDGLSKARNFKESPGLKEKMDDDSATSVVLNADSEGKIICDKCSGDTSDMVKPFWRLTKHAPKGKAVKSFSVPSATHFWNVEETRQCMKDKYVLFLGDSTTVENLNDMLLLLAGGPKKVSPGKFYSDVTHMPHTGQLKWNTEDGELLSTYTSRNRNQTVTMGGQKMLLKYRFAGAVKLAGNCGGLSTLLEESVKQEIANYVENGGRKPDVIVINSALHDMCNAQLHHNKLRSFYDSIDKVGEELIKPWVEQGIKVVWRGNYRFAKEAQDIVNPALGDYRVPEKMDLLAKETVEKHGASYVDIPDLIAHVHDDTGCCQTINSATTTFPHLGAVSVYHNPAASTFLSQLVTYKVLDSIC